MRRGQWIAIGVLLLVAIFIARLALRNRLPPPMPNNAMHVWQGPDNCLACHDTGGPHPRSKTHTVRRDCQSCHLAR